MKLEILIDYKNKDKAETMTLMGVKSVENKIGATNDSIEIEYINGKSEKINKAFVVSCIGIK